MSKKFASKENLITFWGKVKALVASNVTTAGTGLSKSGTTLNHSNSVTAGTIGTTSATSGSSLDVPYATYDAQGHIKTKGTHTHTVTGFATSSHTHAGSDITSAISAARVPNLDASKITTGTLGAARIPNLDAGKITTGTLSADRIPTLDASKITGTITADYLVSNGSTMITLNIPDGLTVGTVRKVVFNAQGIVGYDVNGRYLGVKTWDSLIS